MVSCELLVLLIVLIIAILKGQVTATSPSKVVRNNVASILQKIDQKPEWGTPVNANLANPFDNNGTVTYPINLVLTKEGEISGSIYFSTIPATDAMVVMLQMKVDGTNWETVASCSATGGVITIGEWPGFGAGDALTTTSLIFNVPHINSSTGFRLALVQTGASDPEGQIDYTYNTLE